MRIKHLEKIWLAGLVMVKFTSCDPQTDSIGDIGPAPTNGNLTVDSTDPYNPVFKATADNGYIFQWNLGNGQKVLGQTVTSYYPFSGNYNVVCTIYGAGAKSVTVTTTYNVAVTDPEITTKPYWKELTGAGAGRTWVYNTDPATGFPDYCFQTYFDLEEYPNHWKPENSWGQCERITPDINGEMVFELNGGVNYTYHHVAGDNGIKGTFTLNTDKMTLTVVNPYILDHAISCTNPAVTATGVYQIKLLTDDEMVLWQDQKDGVTGWSWSFKRKGYTP